MLMKLSVLFSLLYLVLSLTARAGMRDTLSDFHPEQALSYYTAHDVEAEAARFDLPAPGCLRSVTLWLNGKVSGTAKLTIYGNEGMFPAPILQQRIGYPITVQKNGSGLRKIEIPVPGDFCMDGTQFFLEVSELSPGLVWVTDNVERIPRCQDDGESWLYQAVKKNDGQWYMGKYTYGAEAVVEYTEDVPAAYMKDVTADAGFDLELTGTGDPGSIAWGDVDDNSYPDLLLGGHLWMNQAGERFEIADERIGGSLETNVHHFFDMENDGDQDILVLGLPGSKALALVLENDGSGSYREKELDVPNIEHPVSIAFADADQDGYLDVFIAQGNDSLGNNLPGIFLLNRKGESLRVCEQAGTTAASSSLQPHDSSSFSAVIGVQWIDWNDDGRPDLVETRRVFNQSRIFLNSGKGGHPYDWESLQPALVHGTTSGTEWGDIDADGNPDVLAPLRYGPDSLHLHSEQAGPLYEYSESTLHDNHTTLIPWEGFRGAGLWSDLNNDGKQDALLLSSCNCRPVGLYLMSRDGSFQEKTFEWGLRGVPAGEDGVLADWNGDGKMDLAAFVGGRFRLFRNTIESDNYLAVDLSGGPAGVVSGRAFLYSGNSVQMRSVESGRGMLMQKPLAVHFGLEQGEGVDSVVIDWDGGAERRVLRNPDVHRIYRPFKEVPVHSQEVLQPAISATPNPFGNVLNLHYTVSVAGNVRITMHSLEGEELAEVLNKELPAGEHQAEWRARDRNGDPLPAGIYIYRIRTAQGSSTGRAVLSR